METKYVLITNKFSIDNTAHISYGIALVSVYDDVMSVLQSISDISYDKASVERLVNTCNNLSLDPVHFQDVVDDFIENI